MVPDSESEVVNAEEGGGRFLSLANRSSTVLGIVIVVVEEVSKGRVGD